jgi:NADH:ubiquinone oxidoreductase subunit H
MFVYIMKNLCLFLTTIVPVLISVAFFTLGDRKVMASIQRRTGPSFVGWFGLLQPFADGFKLILKEMLIPKAANKVLFVFAP